MTSFASGFQIDSALQIRTATEPFEISQLRAVLDAEHYLKAGRPAGHVIWQGVYEHDPEDSGKKNDCELPVSQILLKQETRAFHPQH